MRKISDSFKFGQKKCPKIKPSEICKRPKFRVPCWLAEKKPDLYMTRKDLEMSGIVKAVARKLEPEDPFKSLVVDY